MWMVHTMAGRHLVILGEPFVDKNDDGVGDASPFEEYIDVSGNGSYNAPQRRLGRSGCAGSGCLSSKMIWTSITLAFTGNGYYCAISPSNFAIANGGSQSFSAMVGDINANKLVSGATIAVAASVGTLPVKRVIQCRMVSVWSPRCFSLTFQILRQQQWQLRGCIYCNRYCNIFRSCCMSSVYCRRYDTVIDWIRM